MGTSETLPPGVSLGTSAFPVDGAWVFGPAKFADDPEESGFDGDDTRRLGPFFPRQVLSLIVRL
jgi:hypothetical protein